MLCLCLSFFFSFSCALAYHLCEYLCLHSAEVLSAFLIIEGSDIGSKEKKSGAWGGCEVKGGKK